MSANIQARCEATHMEPGGIKAFTFRLLGQQTEILHDLRPGKHVAISYPDQFGVTQERLYSITNQPREAMFEIAVKSAGRGGVSDSMHAALHEGANISVRYVAGEITVDTVLDFERLGMIAGGIGVTLPIALLRELDRSACQGKHVPQTTLIVCFPRMADVPFLQELLQLSLTASWFKLQIHLTREDAMAAGPFVSGRPSATSLLAMGQPQSVVICGSHAFAQTFREHVRACFPSASQQIESFTPPAAQLPQDGSELPQACRIEIADNGQVVEAESGRSLLEMLEGEGISIRSQCRAGICGSCRVRVTGGSSRFEADFCLSDSEREKGYALACCTFPMSGNIQIDLRPGA